MIRWRLASAALLLLLLGIPAGLPALDLIAHPQAWRAWGEVERLLSLAANTLGLVAGTLALTLPAGVVAALLLYRTDLPLRGLLRFCTLLALFVPLPLSASAWQAAFGTSGWLPLPAWRTPEMSAPWATGFGPAIWVHVVAGLPWVIVLVGLGLTWVERELEEDALTVCGPWRVLWRVTLPRSRACLGAAALWVALQTATEITVTDLMQVRTFAEEVYTQFVRPELDPTAPGQRDVLARAVAVSVPASLLSWLLVLWAASRWERNLPPLEQLTGSRWVFNLGRARWPCLAVCLAVAGLLVGVPLASLVWKAGLHGSPRTWSLGVVGQHLATSLWVRGRLIGESLLLAAGAGLVTAALGLVVCWLAVGTRWFLAGVLTLAAAVWALPGPVLGIGLKRTIDLVLDLTDSDLLARVLYRGPSPVPVLWAYLLRFFPYALALLWPVVRLMPQELRDAAKMDGVGPAGEFWHIVRPLTARASLRAALAVGVLALGELSAGKLVETPGSQTFAHVVFMDMHYGVGNDLAAMCLILLGTVVVGASVLAVFARRGDSLSSTSSPG